MTMYLSEFQNSHFQNEAKCKTFVVKMSFTCMEIKNHFQTNGFALSLASKQRLEATRRWTVEVAYDAAICKDSEQFNIVLFQCCSLYIHTSNNFSYKLL